MDSHLGYWNAICYYDMPSYAMTCSGNLSYNSYSATREARWFVLLGTLVHLVPWRMTMSYHSGLIIHVEINSISSPFFWWLIHVNTQFRSYWGCGFLLSIIGLPGLPHYNTLHISHPGSGALHLHKGERLVDIGVETSWWYRGTNKGGIRLRLGYHEIGMDSAEAWGSDPNFRASESQPCWRSSSLSWSQQKAPMNREILQGDLCLMAQFILNPNTLKPILKP